MEREFKGVWIPKEVWLNKELSLTEKALLAEIDSFTGEGKAFYKSNETAPASHRCPGHVEFDGRRRKVTYQADRKIFTGRRKEFYGQTVNNLPADRKNSTSINTVKEQVKEQSKKSRGFTPPNLEECMSNFQGAGSTSDEGEKFFNFYTSKGWMVGRSKMKDWKAAARNWIKRNNDEQRNKTTAKTSPSRDEFDNYIRHGII